ncbi:MAG: hypothetical protein QOJ50_1604 [Cryptosporangiaceae bacterium]|nr:hypothetical protein [Cryptosporangiaceae bacterium]
MRDVQAYLRQLAEVAQLAGRDSEVTAQASALVEAQRIAAWGLRTAVTLARERGLSWRELADLLNVSAATLHRQYRSGQALTAAPSVFPEPPLLTADVPVGPAASPPPALDLFVGRDRELADAPSMLTRRRLVTLTGAAGVGKSRLAAELAARVRGFYRGGVVWVELAPLTGSAPVGPAITAAAGGVAASADPLGEACAAGPVLLVLDNCEHLVTAVAAEALSLLAGYPQLRILATSREALRIPGEAVLPVLPLPAAPADPADPGFRNSPAVRLFTDRARATVHDFEPGDHAELIAAVCNGLDGLPLAIELAARQIAVLTPQSLLDRLGERLDLLHGGPRGAPPRQQSLRAAIAWSYGLLEETEQQVFRRLALLPGGFDQQTAAAVTGGLGLGRAGLWALLAQLAGKSLAYADPSATGRLRILESVRVFGAEQLADAGEDAGVLDALADWFCGHAHELTTAVWGESTAELMARISAEHDNIRFAVDEAERRRHPRYVPLAILLAASWGMRGDLSEARRLLEHVLRGHDPSAAERSEALRRLSVTESRSGDAAAARRYAEDALAIAREQGDPDLTSRALNALMFAHRRAGDTAAVIAIAREDIALLRVSGHPRELIGSLNNLAWTLLGTGQADAAQPLIDEALAMPGADGADSILSTAGAAALCRDDVDTAERHFLRALVHPETYHEVALHCCEALAVVAARRSDAERALRLFAAVDAFRANHGFGADPWWSGIVAEATTRAWSEAPAATRKTALAVGSALTLDEAREYAESGHLPERYEAARSALTPREYQVAELVARGYTNGQIAARLGMSDRTVVTHVAHIRTKLDLPTRIHIASWFADQRATTS